MRGAERVRCQAKRVRQSDDAQGVVDGGPRTRAAGGAGPCRPRVA